MDLLKKIKLGMKVSMGFAMIFAVLVIAIIFSLVGVHQMNNHFTEYIEISTDQILVGRIQANLLESRLASENFIQLGEQEQRHIFDSRFNKMEDLIVQLKANMKSIETQKIMEDILEHSREYKYEFSKIVAYNEQRATLYKTLTIKGPEMEQSLSELLELAHQKQDETLVYGAGNALRHLLSARLQASRFLEMGELYRVNLVTQEISQMEQWVVRLEAASDSEEERKLLDEIRANKEIYAEHFIQISGVIQERNIVIMHLDVIGPEISAKAENIKLAIIDQQTIYQPKIKEEHQLLLIRMMVLIIIALFLSVVIAVGIIRMVIFPVRVVTDTFKDISEGEADLSVRLKIKSEDELGQMAKYFNNFMEKLHVIMDENKQQSWLKTGQAELSGRISGDQDIKELSCNILGYIASYMGVHIGTLYIRNENAVYELQGSYGYKNPTGVSDEIALGEGLIGQAARQKRRILVTNVPTDYLKISSGVGEASPKNIIVMPCLLNNDTICIIELGTFDEFTPIQLKLLDEMSKIVAISINSLQIRMKTDQLLQKTLIQSEELQVQQEELRQSNEEFEEQTNALKESEERLQEQQEELKVINEELIEHTKSLEFQKDESNKKNESLLRAQKEIEEKAQALEGANKYKSEFLANMSHELRTPLNSILVLSELLSNKKNTTPFTEKQLEFASTIHASGTELLRLINDILDLSKIEVGKMEVNLEPMSLQELAYALNNAFGQIAENKGLVFKVEVDSRLPESINTDMQKVRQIANNLLSNAFKFTEKGSVTLSIAYLEEEKLSSKPGTLPNTFSISITDTGIGIPIDKQSVVFEAFKQADGTISRKYGGTGLGLSITKELAQLLGGSIHLLSEEAKGSTFTLLLPIETVKASKVSEPLENMENLKIIDNKKEIALQETIIKAEDEKLLLIIEDDADFANVLQEIAKEKGYKCITSADGQTGIKLAHEYRPDAILLDIGLPDMNGWEVIEELRKSSEMDIPIHILSGKSAINKSDEADAVIGYMQKPASVHKINKVFNRIEAATTKKFKKILVLGMKDDVRCSIDEMIDEKESMIFSSQRGEEALELLKAENFDCIILDLKLKDMSAFDFLNRLAEETTIQIPLIIYTEQELTADEASELQKYAKSIIIQGIKSMERLTLEVDLFLHELNTKGSEEDKKGRISKEKEEALKGRKILIVDDDMRNVFALSSALEEKGIRIVVGRNGREGINKLSQHADIDLILMDIMMPEMDGYSAMKEIRKLNKFSKIPIIALTAKAMKEDREKCIEAGANDYLTKPIQVDRLISLLRVWLHR